MLGTQVGLPQHDVDRARESANRPSAPTSFDHCFAHVITTYEGLSRVDATT